MPQIITGTPSTDHGPNPISFSAPADGDVGNAASVVTPLQALADYVARLTPARKTADQSESAGALTNVTDLSFPVAANGVYEFEFVLQRATALTTTGMQVALTGPAAPTRITASYIRPNYNGNFLQEAINAFGVATVNAATGGSQVNGGIEIACVRGILQNGANAGTVQLQFKSGVGASAVTIYAGSTVRFNRVA